MSLSVWTIRSDKKNFIIHIALHMHCKIVFQSHRIVCLIKSTMGLTIYVYYITMKHISFVLRRLLVVGWTLNTFKNKHISCKKYNMKYTHNPTPTPTPPHTHTCEICIWYVFSQIRLRNYIAWSFYQIYFARKKKKNSSAF